jgi:ubiquitin C-terminal hydrolase
MSANNYVINYETESETEPEPIKVGVSKFKNIMGITCYMNSILHVLQQVPIFMEYISQAKFRDTIIQKINHQIKVKNLEYNPENCDNIIKQFVVFELFKLFKVSLENDDSVITPTSFKKIIGTKNDRWNEYNHQDSQEFFTFLISQIEEDVGMKCTFIPGLDYLDNQQFNFNDSISNIVASSSWINFQSKEYSPLKNIFDGLIETNRRCMCCGSKTAKYEPFVTLSLSIPINNSADITKSFDIYECLNHMVEEEQLDNDNKMNCEMCSLKNQGYTKSILWKSPKLLVLHIKRFLVNSYGVINQKLNNNIIYPINNLDICNYFDIASPYKNQSKYDLIGINLHQSFGDGRNINNGHYTSIVKNILNNNWYLYNDSNPLKMVYTKEQLQNQNAYLLFYYRHD